MSAEDRRRQLIDVAIDLFSRKGFGGTTTKEIAAAAGVTEAIIFRHFANKLDLYTAILDTIKSEKNVDKWLTESQRLMDVNDDEGLIRLLVTNVVETIQRDPRFERLMIMAALEGHELAELHMQKYAIPVVERIIEYFQRRQAEGGLAQGRPEVMLLTIVGAAHFYAMHRFVYQFHKLKTSRATTGADCEFNAVPDVIDDLTRYITRGLLAPAPKGKKK